MIKKDDYVFSLEFGIGLIKAVLPNNKYLVKYEDIEKDEEYYDINIISNTITNQIITGKFKDYYSINTLDRGKEYFLEDKISNLTIMDNNIYAKAKGTTDYSLSIIASNISIRAKCSCPVGNMCKHSAATLFLIENKINRLKENKINISNRSFDSIINMALLINPDFTQLKDLDRLKLVKDELVRRINNDKDLIEFINFMDKYRIETNNYLNTKLLLISIISFSNKLRSFTYNTKGINNKYLLGELMRLSKINPDKLSNSYPEDIKRGIIYSISNDDYALYIKFIAYLPNNYYREFFMNNYNDNILKDVISSKYISKVNNTSLLKDIFKRTDIAGKKYIASEIKTPFLDIDDINLDVSDKIQFLSLVDNDHNVYKYISENYNIAKLSDIKSLYFICYYLINSDKLRRSEINIIKTLLESDYNSKYILDFINFEYFKVDNINLFLRIFNITYNTMNINGTYRINHLITLGNNDEIMAFERTITPISDSVDYSLFNPSMENELKDLCQSILMNDYNYINDYNILMEKYKRKETERKTEEYRIAIESFDLKDMSLTLLDNNFKVNIDYIIDEEYDYKNNRVYILSLKVYIDGRKYIVKDIIEFLNNIRESKDYKYGKELEFNHRIDNFNDKEIKILEYLLLQPNNRYSNNKGLALSIRSFEELIKLLINRYITFNDKEYFVRLDNKKIEISIDDNYILKNNINDESFVIGENNLYLFNDKYVDKIDGEIDYLKLLKFTIDYKNMDLSLVKSEFIDKIYSRYYDVINVNPLLEDEFKLSLLRIDAYFDIVKGCVFCETKLYKDNILITSDNLLSDSDKNHLGVYLKHLNKIGFVNFEVLSDSSKILEFFRMDFTELRKVCNVYLSDSITNKKLSKFQAPTIRISYENNIMNAFLDDTSYSDEELYEIMRAIRQKKRFVLFNDDRIIELNESSIEFYDTICDLRLDLKNLRKNNKINIYDSISALAHNNNCKIDEYVTKIIDEIRDFKKSDINIPDINADLREYQKEGYKWLSILSKYSLGGILADDMGLGKTLEIITLLKSDMTEKPTLIVCPKSLIFNWYSEINKFDGFSRAIMIYGNQNERHKIIKNINNQIKIIYITAYDSLRNDLSLYDDKYFNYIILDEAQAIKNVNSIKSVSVKSLNSLRKFALTGTPIENSIIDLWSIFDFLMPGYLEDLSIFKSKYLSNEKYTDIISIKIAPFILRRTKSEVLDDLPNKYEKIISCDMTNDQRLIYEAHIKDAKDKIESGSDSFELLPYLTRLRQICIDPKLFIEDYISDSGKMIKFEEIVNEYKSEHKILVFSSFVSALERCREILIKENVKFFMLTGSTKLDERKRLVDLFNTDPSVKVFLISLKAGGTGLNLTGADTVIHLDPWWNLSAENQASDRAHRIGQTKNVEVLKLVAINSLEERVIELQNLKKDIIDKVISNDDSRITNFSIDDLKYILG